MFPDASEKKRYLEILVGQHSEGYSKGSKLKFERFKQNVDLAVEQAALFAKSRRRLERNWEPPLENLYVICELERFIR